MKEQTLWKFTCKVRIWIDIEKEMTFYVTTKEPYIDEAKIKAVHFIFDKYEFQDQQPSFISFDSIGYVNILD